MLHQNTLRTIILIFGQKFGHFVPNVEEKLVSSWYCLKFHVNIFILSLNIFLSFYPYWGSLSYKMLSYKKKKCIPSFAPSSTLFWNRKTKSIVYKAGSSTMPMARNIMLFIFSYFRIRVYTVSSTNCR